MERERKLRKIMYIRCWLRNFESFLLSCDIIFDFLLHFVEKVYYAIMLVHYFLRMKLIDYLQEI